MVTADRVGVGVRVRVRVGVRVGVGVRVRVRVGVGVGVRVGVRALRPPAVRRQTSLSPLYAPISPTYLPYISPISRR